MNSKITRFASCGAAVVLSLAGLLQPASAGPFTPNLTLAPRSEAEAQVQDPTLERVAERLFRLSVEKYDDGAYWHASRELIILLDYYSSFSEIDGVLYYLASCLYEMDMFKSSNRTFRYLIENYPKSKYLPKALLGMQKLLYNSQELDNSLRYFTGITTRFAEESVLDGSHYYGGMAYYHQKKYDEAISTLGKIRSRSEYYDYGLYTVGLCFLKKKILSSRSEPFGSSFHFLYCGMNARMSSLPRISRLGTYTMN